ncbi:hypothetical protein GCM10009646_76750 [Streptomyces aureus]
MSGGLGSHMWGMVKHYRFAVHTPDQLWAMVESADGSTPADLGALLTSAAKTIKEIGDDLKTHSTAVEWDGEGGDAFRKWVHGAALATLSLGDYSEGAGKWMAHAADTLHEVKPQLEILKNSSASARSILDAHAAKATDVGNHVGGPSEASVTSAKSQYDNDSAEAAQLMIKLAQSYAASTEQIDALKAPEFPDMPKRFVPKRFDGNEDVGESPSTSSPNAGTAAAVGGVGVAAAGTAVVREAARGASLAGDRHTAAAATSPRAVPDMSAGGTSTGLDRVGTLPPSATPPATSPSPSPTALPGGTSGIGAPPPGAMPPVFGGTGRSSVPSRGVAGSRLPSSSTLGPRGPLGPPAGTGMPGTPGASRPVMPGRGVPGVTGTPSGSASPVRGPGGATPGRPSNGIAGGRPVSSQAGRSAGAMPRATVVGSSPAQPSLGVRGGAEGGPRTGAVPGRGGGATSGRGSGSTAARMPAHSDGIAGGQPQPSKARRNPSVTTRGTGLVRGTESDPAQVQRGGPAQGSSTASRKDGARTGPAEGPLNERPAQGEAETEAEQTAQPLPPPRLPGLPDA